MTCQLHQLLLGLIPGGAKKALSAAQAKALLASIRPRDPAGKARRRVAAELISDLEHLYHHKKAADKELRDLLKATGTTLARLNGIGPSSAARLLVERIGRGGTHLYPMGSDRQRCMALTRAACPARTPHGQRADFTPAGMENPHP